MIAKVDKERWHQSWFKNVSKETKLLYGYIWDNADEAGVWRIDMEGAALAIGSPEASMDESIDALIAAKVAKILEIDGVSRLWLTRYCLQYPTLSDRYTGHRRIIRLIRLYDLFGEPVIKSLFRDGYQYTVDRQRKKLKLDVVDEEQPGERELFNSLNDEGIPLTWENWRRLCQLYPKMNKRQTLFSISKTIPVYLPTHIHKKGEPFRVRKYPKQLWAMVVDIAEYSEKGTIYTPAIAESLLSKWTEERMKTWHLKKRKKDSKPL